MTVAHFVEGAWPRQGGVGIACVPKIAIGLARRGIHAAVIYGGPPAPGSVPLAENGGSCRFASQRSWGRYAFAPSLLWRAMGVAREADVIALHSVYSFPVLAGYLHARWFSKPYVLWPHGVLGPFQRTIGRRKKWVYDRLVARRMLRGASAIVFTAAQERDDVAALNLGARSVVIPHGIDLAAYRSLPPRGAFRRRYLEGHPGPLILYLGRLAPVKNLELAIAAMPRVLQSVPGARLALAGPADPSAFAATVAEWTRKYRVSEQVVLTGPIVDADAKLEAFADADLFVMPSHNENFCHALFEAMAAGVPAVVSDSITYAAEIASRNAGIASPRDPVPFAEGMLRLLQQPSLRAEMGRCAAQLAACYSLDQSAERIARLLHAVAGRAPMPDDLQPALLSGSPA